jgi:hypothetical protein
MTRLIATKQLRWSRHWLPYIDVATQRLRRGGGKIKRNAVPRPWAELTAFDRRNQVGLCTAADVSQRDYWLLKAGRYRESPSSVPILQRVINQSRVAVYISDQEHDPILAI